MQAVILAAGRGTRMGDLTRDVPKPLLAVSGKSLLAHKLRMLPEAVTEVVIVIGYQGERIRQALGEEQEGRKLSYVVQETLNGTAGALWEARGLLTDRFLIMMGDDLYAREDMERALGGPDWAMVVTPVKLLSAGGKVVTNDAGEVLDIVEGSHGKGPGLMNTNCFALDPRLFEYPMLPKAPGSDEYGLPQTVLAASRAAGIPLATVEASWWVQVTAPEDLIEAETRLRNR